MCKKYFRLFLNRAIRKSQPINVKEISGAIERIKMKLGSRNSFLFSRRLLRNGFDKDNQVCDPDSKKHVIFVKFYSIYTYYKRRCPD